MSIRVEIDELLDELDDWGAAALITVGEGGARVVTAFPASATVDGRPVLSFESIGRSAIANVRTNPVATLYFAPHPASAGYSLIVDGAASVREVDRSADDTAEHAVAEIIELVPTSAVRHRPPPAR